MEMISEIIMKYPMVGNIVFAVGLLRIIFKPLMAIVMNVVEYTETPKDNEFIQKIMSSWAYGKIVWFIDYMASIKLPPKTLK